MGTVPTARPFEALADELAASPGLIRGINPDTGEYWDFPALAWATGEEPAKSTHVYLGRVDGFASTRPLAGTPVPAVTSTCCTSSLAARHEAARPAARRGVLVPAGVVRRVCLPGGEVKMVRNEVLDSTDPDDGWVLGCQALPVSDSVAVTFD
jgi:hypothetical protein